MPKVKAKTKRKSSGDVTRNKSRGASPLLFVEIGTVVKYYDKWGHYGKPEQYKRFKCVQLCHNGTPVFRPLFKCDTHGTMGFTEERTTVIARKVKR